MWSCEQYCTAQHFVKHLYAQRHLSISPLHLTLNTVKPFFLLSFNQHFIAKSVSYSIDVTVQPPFYLRNLFHVCVAVHSAALFCTVEICLSVSPTKPLPSQIKAPIASVKWLPQQPTCSSAISGTRRRREVCSIMLVTCSEYCERLRGREEEDVFRTLEPSSKSLK